MGGNNYDDATPQEPVAIPPAEVPQPEVPAENQPQDEPAVNHESGLEE